MADHNMPPKPSLADSAKYRCPTHPLVHSDRAGQCTVCAANLESAGELAAPEALPPIPDDAKFASPMEECRQFSAVAGECPKCGMDLKPIDEVPWAKKALDEQRAIAANPIFVCPMHPEQVKANKQGRCSLCGMNLIHLDSLPQPTDAPAAIAVQVNYLMEHYLEIQKRLASDSTADVAANALGLVSAAEEISKRLDAPGHDLPVEVGEALVSLRSAALRTTGKSLEADRVTFVELSAAMRTLVERVRPDKKRFPDIYIFHCPMSKGDWLQTSESMANPYYGFKMLKCGDLISKD